MDGGFKEDRGALIGPKNIKGQCHYQVILGGSFWSLVNWYVGLLGVHVYRKAIRDGLLGYIRWLYKMDVRHDAVKIPRKNVR